jgi:hypothetical protein
LARSDVRDNRAKRIGIADPSAVHRSPNARAAWSEDGMDPHVGPAAIGHDVAVERDFVIADEPAALRGP